MISAAAQTSTLVVLGLKPEGIKEQMEELNRLAEGDYFTDETFFIKDTAGLCLCGNAKLVGELVKRLNKINLNGECLHALSLTRYMAMYNIGKLSVGKEQVYKPAVKKIIGEEEIDMWRAEALGEQFLIYNEDTLSNYQLSKMFPCKLIKSKPIKEMEITVKDELIFAQKQKNLFVYGGYLDLLDGFVMDDIISHYTLGKHIVIGCQIDPNQQLWSIYNIYSKKNIKEVVIGNEETFSVSAGMTHYMISNEKGVQVRQIESDELIYPEYFNIENEKTEGFMSDKDNVVLIVKKTSISTQIILHSLDSGRVIRKRVFTNIESYSVAFAPGEVSIVSVRMIVDKVGHFIEIWNVDGKTVISKALGENVKNVYPSKHTVVVQTPTSAKILKRVQNILVEGAVVREPISKIVAGEITLLLIDSGDICIIGKDGEILNRVLETGASDIQMSPFGLYISLLSSEQVRILDICGKEVFASNIKRNNGFFWRTVVSSSEEVILNEEEIQKYKTEDSLRRKEARKQFMRDNEEKIKEWRMFLHEMKRFKSLNAQVHS
ncbi:hypothetical protein NEIRO03_0831 [Nematocida sp. AWRm78]|nr:hypothetical protein NEIRO02_0755 [Nematocida sp. AWRm79]KAI5183213.1 hypothetical protein NEIRO03_0831 [Nematocida sp. AWRm78]